MSKPKFIKYDVDVLLYGLEYILQTYHDGAEAFDVFPFIHVNVMLVNGKQVMCAIAELDDKHYVMHIPCEMKTEYNEYEDSNTLYPVSMVLGSPDEYVIIRRSEVLCITNVIDQLKDMYEDAIARFYKMAAKDWDDSDRDSPEMLMEDSDEEIEDEFSEEPDIAYKKPPKPTLH